MKRAKKRKRNLETRIRTWENLKSSSSDIARKHPLGFRKPGSNQ